MKPYPKYRDSGVEWIGNIPESWRIDRTKYILFERKELSEIGTEDLLSVSEYYGVARRADKIAFDDILVRAESLAGYKIAHENDLVVNIMLAWKKALGVSQQYGIVSPAYCVYKFLPAFFPKYFHYLFRTDMYADIFKVNSTGIIDSRLRLYSENLFSIESILPPLQEQATIAAFLDRKTAEIDSIIAKKERLIELYEEEKAAVINHAATKGIDTAAKMKDSGIEWLGEIPEHWEVKRLKHISEVRQGVTKGRDLSGKKTVDFPYLRVANVQDGYLDLSEVRMISILENELNRFLLKEGDVLMNEGGDNDKLGRGAVWKGEIERCLHQNHVFSVRPFTKSLGQWISIWTSSATAKIFFFISGKQTTNLASLSSSNIKELSLPIPNEEERKNIMLFLNQKTKKIDTVISKFKRQIELMKEYRTALISEAVTGKIDVRE